MHRTHSSSFGTALLLRLAGLAVAALGCSSTSVPSVPPASAGAPDTIPDAGAPPARADAALPPWLPTTPADTAVTYQINPAHTGLQTADTFKPPFKQKWVKDFAAVGGAVVSYPLIVDGRVFVTVSGDSGGVDLYALHDADGSVAWGPTRLSMRQRWAAAKVIDTTTLPGQYNDQNVGPIQGLAIAHGMLVVAAGAYLVAYQ